jgi:hypothetical protein
LFDPHFLEGKNGKMRRDTLELDLADLALDEEEPLVDGDGREDVMISPSASAWEW